MLGFKPEDAFRISLAGAEIAQHFIESDINTAHCNMANATKIAEDLLLNINGLDDQSITNACKLVSFDIWRRSLLNAIYARDYSTIEPDNETINNLRIYILRSIDFWQKYGPVVKSGFTFESPQAMKSIDKDELSASTYSDGGYTSIVSTGDGDYLTADTLWDFKVSKNGLTSKQTLQLAMYWIMGKHSQQSIYSSIRKIGVFNPKLNTMYLLEAQDIAPSIVHTIEQEVICYPIERCLSDFVHLVGKYNDIGLLDYYNWDYNNYTLFFYDLQEKTISEFICSNREMISVIHRVANTENAVPQWIGTNHVARAYVVGMLFNK